jgi:hypothetical protein
MICAALDRARLRVGDYNGALQRLGRVGFLLPKLVRCHCEVLVLALMGRKAEAERLLAGTLRETQGRAKGWRERLFCLRGYELTELGRYDEAEESMLRPTLSRLQPYRRDDASNCLVMAVQIRCGAGQSQEGTYGRALLVREFRDALAEFGVTLPGSSLVLLTQRAESVQGPFQDLVLFAEIIEGAEKVPGSNA